ncbi:MAG: hypothetical protein ISS71_05875 [Phycisphaerae bacterium]|nr:hypothetical protein [Phycisphaerae bacterium]
MKIGRILHQQIVQLKWHFLACLGLLMALPIEEGIINVKDGHGFYASGLSLGIPIMVGPLLAGLIACGNVQADLDDKRYIFWRSKPVGVKTFMAIKYLVGLFIAFIVIACPIAFTLISCMIQKEKIERGFMVYVVNFQLISLLAYSSCFFCNVLVRKTARAWLIGMAMVVFLMLVPFILPLNFKDVASDFLFVASMAYLSVTLIPSLIAFIVSLVAASRNWHLQTNLKGLLWTGASLIFLLMLLFTHQVASIKVLDEVEVPKNYALIGGLQRLYDNTREGHLLDVDISNGRIELKDVYLEPSEETRKKLETAKQLYSVGEKGLGLNIYPHSNRVLYNVGNDIFNFKLNTYTHREEIRKNTYYKKLDKAYLCSDQVLEGLYSIPVSAMDLSDCIVEGRIDRVGLRKIGDKIIVLIQDGFAVVQIKDNGSLELIDNQIDGLKGHSRYGAPRDKRFKIPLVSVQDISTEERIKLTIDINYRYYQFGHSSGWPQNEIWSHSLVDINGSAISFCLLDEGSIQRYDIVKWDDEFVYCRFRDERPFTFLEQMFGQVTQSDPWFVQDGKLYAYERQKLMVYDIHSGRIRKLGHFEQLSENFIIQGFEVLDNGNMLLSAVKRKYLEDKRNWERKSYLFLLKNPE